MLMYALRSRTLATLLVTGFIASGTTLEAADKDLPPRQPTPGTAAQRNHFEKHVRPLLIRHCYSCHSANAKPPKGGLRLDSRLGWQTGGDSGRAVVPGRPGDSLLIQAVRYDDDTLKMPPRKKLSEAEIRLLERWVSDGAFDPRTGQGGGDRKRGTADHWAFRPLDTTQRTPSRDRGWSTSPVDSFILARLQASGLSPSPEADRRTLLRRITFDLTGLPPSPDDLNLFLSDTQPGAWQRLVDRLLASPHYGQRWGRHWLDVARYADSNGLDENVAHGTAWRYRDWVIGALNADRPISAFIADQVAGDLRKGPAEETRQQRHDRLIATGFLSLGPKVLAEVDEKKMEMDIVDEQVDTVGRAFLGLTLGCARCHDHKFDPISTRDYYALAGVFQSTRTMEHFRKVARWHENPIASPEDDAAIQAHQGRIAAKKAEIATVVKTARKLLNLSPGADDKGQAKPGDIESQFPKDTRDHLKQLREQLETLRKSTPTPPTAMGVTEGKVSNLPIHIRGSHLDLGEVVPRDVPKVFRDDKSRPFSQEQSGRVELAQWLTSPDNPLTARVFVNRIWRWHFGRGLVASTDNFGQLGTRPTHPHLLDFLAGELVRGNWSLKRLHRMIVLSATYRMQSAPRDDAMAIDPDNQLWWRSPLRRLEAEALRDAMLAVSGLLDPQMTGSLLHVKNRAYFFDHTSKDETRYGVPRRSVYLPVVRNHLYDVFTLFDYTDASVMSGDRATTTVAPQALFLLNSDLVQRVSRQVAWQLLGSPSSDDAERIDRLHERVLGRPANGQDLKRCQAFLARVRKTLGPDANDRDVLAALCHVMLASNEFIYLQ